MMKLDATTTAHTIRINPKKDNASCRMGRRIPPTLFYMIKYIDC